MNKKLQSKAFELNVKVYFDSPFQAENALRSLSPELNEKFEKRSKTLIKTNKNVLFVNVIANDLVSLKASANHYLKLVSLLTRLFFLFRKKENVGCEKKEKE